MTKSLLLSLSLAANWLNGTRPPEPEQIAGRPVVVYFWSRDCARCLSQLDVLQRAQGAAPSALFVGVHSGRTSRERDGRAVREALLGLGVTDLTADDADGRLAGLFDATALPAVLAFGPDGALFKRWNNGVKAEELKEALATLSERSSVKTRPAETPLERDGSGVKTPLAWPQGLAARDGKIFVSDTARHRVLELDARGRVSAVYGTGARGYADGPLEHALFDRPGALFAGEDELYVAELGGLVRRLDFKRKTVASLSYDGVFWPTGVAAEGGRVFVAASAENRVQARPRRSLTFSAFAGTGDHAERDGALAAAAFSAPWGLAVASGTLYVADADSASIRAIALDGGEVVTLARGEPLVRPVALATLAGSLYAADAAAGKIFLVAPGAAPRVACEGLDAPSALAADGASLLVAEAATGRVLRVNPASCAKEVLPLTKLPAVRPGAPEPLLPARATLPAATFVVRPGQGTLRVAFSLPDGWTLNPRSRLSWRVAEAAGALKLDAATRKGALTPPRSPVELKFELASGRGEIALEADFYYCRKSFKGLCRAASVRQVVLLEASPSAILRRAELTLRAD